MRRRRLTTVKRRACRDHGGILGRAPEDWIAQPDCRRRHPTARAQPRRADGRTGCRGRHRRAPVPRGVDYLVAGGKEVSLSELPSGYSAPANASILGIPLFAIVAIAVVAVTAVALRQTRFGRQIYAVGSNPEAAAMLGIPSSAVVFV